VIGRGAARRTVLMRSRTQQRARITRSTIADRERSVLGAVSRLVRQLRPQTRFTNEHTLYEAVLLPARADRLSRPRELRERSLERISARVRRGGVHALCALASARRRQRDNVRAVARRTVRSTVTEEVK
jgi:hypothetical protein